MNTKEINDIIRYYIDRADEYDMTAGYLDKEAEEMRTAIKKRHQAFLANKDVLEIACGTGYWTEVIAKTAKSVLAIDISQKMISIAQKKCMSCNNVTFHVSDAYSLKNISGNFNAAYAHWWWSHIPKSRIRNFLINLHKKLQTGSSVLFVDHLPSYLDKKNKVIYSKNTNRIEERSLRSGKKYLVIKNFPSREEIQSYLSGLAVNADFQEYDRYWELYYTTLK
jgi:ubiquinone/menaquinone biosynthesis C-methylase UbiE